MSIFAFICLYQLLTFKKKVTFRQLFSRPGACDPYTHICLILLTTAVYAHGGQLIHLFLFAGFYLPTSYRPEPDFQIPNRVSFQPEPEF